MGDETPPKAPNLGRFLDRLDSSSPPARVRGRVTEVTGLIIRAAVPGATVGEMVEIDTGGDSPLRARVVGFKGEQAVLMPLGRIEGVGPESPVRTTGEPLRIRCGPGLLGRVVNGLGNPIDGLGPLEGPDWTDWDFDRAPPPPLTRRRIDKPFETGIRVLDGLLTLGVGQRIGLFAPSGVGKSVFLGRLARGAQADVIVIGLVGERGREVRDFIESTLGEEGLARSVVVCATSDEPGFLRMMAAFAATAIAEFFRAQGKQVLLLMDSVTRLAQAQREVGLAAGEPPVRRGYPPSAFSMLPRLLERAGNDDQGSITAVYTALVPPQLTSDPIAEEIRSILDGHIVLSRTLSERAHWPAVDVLQSLSRLMNTVASPEHTSAAENLRKTLATYEASRDLIVLGAYQTGADPSIDEAVEMFEEIEDFLLQDLDDSSPMEETIERLLDLFPDI
jgi:type III secretion protein N (ATPase)